MEELKQPEDIINNFESVKAFVVAKFPEFSSIELLFCEDADQTYHESIEERYEEGEEEPRTYSHVFHYPGKICVTTNMVELTDEQMQGVFIHEFGHLFAEMYPYYEGMDAELGDDQGDADYVVTSIFGVNLHYGDEDELQYVVLPIGSEPLDDAELTEEERQAIAAELSEELSEDEDEEEEHDSYGIGLPSSDELQESLQADVVEPGSIELEGTDGPVIDTEFEQ